METIDLWTKTTQFPKNFTGIVKRENYLEIYYKNGSIHRKDGPAYISKYMYNNLKNFTYIWYKKGKKHRIGGPAVEIWDGSKEWWVNNKKHRIDAPAVVGVDGYREWCINGKWHRTDGPAIEFQNGDKYWYLNNKLYFGKTEIPILLKKNVFLNMERGKYDLFWLRFLTEDQGIKEFPMIPGIREFILSMNPELKHYFDECGWI